VRFGAELEVQRAALVEAFDRGVGHAAVGAELALEHVALADAQQLHFLHIAGAPR
jgi:hypothetical protein